MPADRTSAPLLGAGVLGFGLRTVGAHYFDWHHSNADTFDKVDPDDFQVVRGRARGAQLTYWRICLNGWPA
jgi:hypothetical protein